MANYSSAIIASQVIITLLHVLALSSTVLRLLDRFFKQRMWWDDYLAVLPLCTDAIFLAMYWLSFGAGASGLSHSPFFSLFTYSLLHLTTIWSSRIILALGLARIFPPGQKIRRVSLGLAALFCITGIGLIFSTTALCTKRGTPFYRSTPASCTRGKGRVPLPAVIVLICDAVTEASLVVVPFQVLRRMKLPKHQKRLILLAGSASLFTFMTLVAFCVLWYGPFKFGNGSRGPNTSNIIISHIEVTTCLTVSNLLVVVSFLYRMKRKVQFARGRPMDSTAQSDTTTTSETASRSNWRTGTRPTERSTMPQTEITTLSLTEVISVFSEPRYSQWDDEYLDVDSEWVTSHPTSGSN
ncbi:hypothetical protein CPC08DRAFT_819094 [Agrocybe pediades]|nr:hypothetical protein CPC08DRAFT_819094 [Agrocybe pediades]